MNSNLKLALFAATLASASLAAPAWSQATTDATAAKPPTQATADAGAQARLRAECYDAGTRSVRSTPNCTGLAVDANGALMANVNASPSAGSAAAPMPYPSDATKPGASTEKPKSLKELSNPK